MTQRPGDIIPPGAELLRTHVSPDDSHEGDAHPTVLDGDYRRHPVGSARSPTEET